MAGTQKAQAESGIHWLTDAVALVLRNPVAFLLMGLIAAIIGIVPILGGLVMVVCAPALAGGIVYAAREQSEGRQAEVGMLFRAFQEPGKIGPMLLLCLPSLAGAFILLVFGLVFGLGALLGGSLSAMGGSDAHILAAMGGGLLLFMFVGLAVALAIIALQFFAVPRVMLDGVEPIAAMKESLGACLSNLGALVVYTIVLFLSFIVLGVVLAFIPLLGWLALMTAMWAVAACAQYLAYRQVFIGAARITPADPVVVPPAPGPPAPAAPVVPPAPSATPPEPPPPETPDAPRRD